MESSQGLMSPQQGSAGDSPGTPGGVDQAVEVKTPGSAISQGPGLGVKCDCGCNEDDGLMILCAVCQFWQHGVCYRIMRDVDAPDRHICSTCALSGDPTRQPTDPTLNGMSGEELQNACLWRRMLMACTETSEFTIHNIVNRLGIKRQQASALIQRLETEGYLLPTKGKNIRELKRVDKEKLEALGLREYFENAVTTSKSAAVKSVNGAKSGQSGTKSNNGQKEKGPDPASSENTDVAVSKMASKMASNSQKDNAKGVQQQPASRASPRIQMLKELKERQNKGGKKRLRTINDLEFELSSTQDGNDNVVVESGLRRRKRFKASVVQKAVEM